MILNYVQLNLMVMNSKILALFFLLHSIFKYIIKIKNNSIIIQLIVKLFLVQSLLNCYQYLVPICSVSNRLSLNQVYLQLNLNAYRS